MSLLAFISMCDSAAVATRSNSKGIIFYNGLIFYFTSNPFFPKIPVTKVSAIPALKLHSLHSNRVEEARSSASECS